MTEQQQAAMRQALVDEDGENKAVRWFLAAYLNPGMTIGGMKAHLKLSGYPLWPEWAERCHPSEHLTKGGAQLWIRHLFALEQQPADEPVAMVGSGFQLLWTGGASFAEHVQKHGIKVGSLFYTRPQPTAPQRSEDEKHWVGLTDEEVRDLRRRNQQHDVFARAIEAKLKEKNGGKHETS